MLEKGKREATKSNAAAITLGLLKCSNIWENEDPILYLLDVLSLTKFESTIINFIMELLGDSITNKNNRFCKLIDGYPVVIIDKHYFTEYVKKNLKVIDILSIEFQRGKIKGKGQYSDSKQADISLDCSEIRRLETKISNSIGKKIIIQIFPKEEIPPIYSIKKDSIIIHCW